MQDQVKSSYFWPSLLQDVKEFVSSCDNCQKRKTVHKLPKAPLMPHPQEEKHNVRVHMDLFGPLKHPLYEHILVITDAFSNYTELAALPHKSAETVVEKFFNQWVCRHSCPVLIITDGGREFQNRL